MQDTHLGHGEEVNLEDGMVTVVCGIHWHSVAYAVYLFFLLGVRSYCDTADQFSLKEKDLQRTVLGFSLRCLPGYSSVGNRVLTGVRKTDPF